MTVPRMQVGTGFSFTNSTQGLSTNESEIATNLYSALTQFFAIYSDYQKNDFYIIGEVGRWAAKTSCVQECLFFFLLHFFAPSCFMQFSCEATNRAVRAPDRHPPLSSVLCREVCPRNKLQYTHGEHATAENLYQSEGNGHWRWGL